MEFFCPHTPELQGRSLHTALSEAQKSRTASVSVPTIYPTLQPQTAGLPEVGALSVLRVLSVVLTAV